MYSVIEEIDLKKKRRTEDVCFFVSSEESSPFVSVLAMMKQKFIDEERKS